MVAEAGHAGLDATQSELEAVKKALRESSTYLGMGGEKLQQYLLRLMEKENLLLSHKLRIAQNQADPDVEIAPSVLPTAFINSSEPNTPAGAENVQADSISEIAPAVPPAAFINSSEPNTPAGAEKVISDAAAEEAATDAKLVEESRDEPTEVTDVKPPPEGEVQAFDRESLPEVVRHLCDYEAVPVECVKTLRAISALAYKHAATVGMNNCVLPQLLRVVDIHRNEHVVQLAATRALCNLAYAPEVALGVLAQPRVFGALLAGIVQGEKREIGSKASEAVARIVAAEAAPEEERPEAYKELTEGKPGALAGLFIAASSGDPAWQGLATSLILQMMANEVVEAQYVASRFVAAAEVLAGPAAIAGWLALAKALATVEVEELPPALVTAGTIRTSIGLMRQAPDSARAQLTGIEALSSLVGSRFAGLQDFANHRGMALIEAAMSTHVDEVLLQTKGTRALSSGVQWPESIQKASGYDVGRSIILAKSAMARHADDVDLQVAALEALSKYIDKALCRNEVRDGGGEELVKASMEKHGEVQKVQAWGRVVLDHLAPRGDAVK